MNDIIQNSELEIEIFGEEEIEYPDVTISVHRDQYSVFQLKRKIEQKLLVVSPEFQRANVWKPKQKSELIESILMGIPIPVFYFFEDINGKQQVVDGKQRISTLLSFLNNEFKLQDLKILGKKNGDDFFNGKKFNELEPKWQAKIEDYQLTVFVIRPPTPENIKYDIFDRVNRGGTQLNSQEIRHALYNGPATLFLEKLAQDSYYEKLIGRKDIDDKRMKGRMMILRFIALYLTYEKKIHITYTSDMNDYLANIMQYLNEIDEIVLNELESIFVLAMQNCHDLLGDDAFRFAKTSESKIRRSINMGLFEMITYALACPIPQNKEQRKKIIQLLDDSKKYIDENKFFARIESKSIIDLRCDIAQQIQRKITEL